MKKVLSLVIVVALVAGVIVAFLFAAPGKSKGETKDYYVTVEEKRIEYKPGQFFTAWTYNGQIPGPLIRANVGDTIRVHLTNKTNLSHSMHVHGFEYTVEHDGSQMSPAGTSMVPPGKTWTYVFKATRPGLYPYHCHSDDRYPLSVHIQQGLQGAILIDDPAKPLPPAKEYLVILNETYDKPVQSIGHSCSYCAMNSKFFALNSRQWPLPQAYNVQTGQIEHPTAKSGEKVRFLVTNLGNDIHTFHLHGHPLYKRPSGNWGTTELVDGDNIDVLTAETAVLETTALSPGNWLYHCHMDVHAELGMMGKFIVTP